MIYIHFLGPFNREVTAQLRLTNHTDKHICFSFWEGRYRVHPQFGILGPSKAIVTAGKLFRLTFGKAIKLISKPYRYEQGKFKSIKSTYSQTFA